MVFVAFYAAWRALNYFVKAGSRTTNVHACGLSPDAATSRMPPSGIYGGLASSITRRSVVKENG